MRKTFLSSLLCSTDTCLMTLIPSLLMLLNSLELVFTDQLMIFSVSQSVASLLLLLKFNSVQPFNFRDESAVFYNLFLCYVILWCSMCHIAKQKTLWNSEAQPWCASSYSGFRKQILMLNCIYTFPLSSVFSSVCLMTRVRVGGSSSKTDTFIKSSGTVSLS